MLVSRTYFLLLIFLDFFCTFDEQHHTIQLLNSFVSCSCLESFRSHSSLYMSLPVNVTCDINPSGSKIDAKCFNILLFSCYFNGISRSTPNVSFDLSQGIPNIWQSVGWVPWLLFLFLLQLLCIWVALM